MRKLAWACWASAYVCLWLSYDVTGFCFLAGGAICFLVAELLDSPVL